MAASVDVPLERKKLSAFLAKHDPSKMNLLDVLLQKFVPEGPAGIEKMWSSLYKRYNVKPGGNEGGPASPSAGGNPGLTAVASPLASPKIATGKAKVAPSAEKPAASPSPKREKAKSIKKDKLPAADAAATSSPPPPSDATATSKAADVEQQRARLTRYFAKHMPDRVNQVDAIVQRIVATDQNGEGWANMWKAFTGRFGPEDPPPATEAQPVPQNATRRVAPLDASSPLTGSNREKTATTPSVFSPTSAPRVDDDVAGKGDGSIPAKIDARSRKEVEESLRDEWVSRLSRYLAHYDAAKSDVDLRKAVEHAHQTPNGMQELWETLLEHYGPEPPQPMSTMFRVMGGGDKARTPRDIAKGLIGGHDASTASATSSGGAAQPAGSSPPPTKGAGAPALPPPQTNTSKRKPWYLDDDEPITSTVRRSVQQPQKPTSTSRSISDGHHDDDATINHVPRNALVIYGVLRLIGINFQLYQRAGDEAQLQFIRSIEQELSYNVDCDPESVTVRRVIPNVAIDFKIDLTAAVQRGTKDARTAHHIGDVLVNRVLNGTFTLRLIRDSYRRDLGGVAADVFTQSCAVFGSESQQFYTMVPDELPPDNVTKSNRPPDTTYAAVAAAPASRDMRPKDVFGSPPSPQHAPRSTQRQAQPSGALDYNAVDQLAQRVHALTEQDRIPQSMHELYPHRWQSTGPGMRPTSSFEPQRVETTGNGRSGDFGARVWDDTVSELSDYQRREETAQYNLNKPEAISGNHGWQRFLHSFSDPQGISGSASARGGLVGAQHRPLPTERLAEYSPSARERHLGDSNRYGRPSKMELKGLQRLSTSPQRQRQASPRQEHRSAPLRTSPSREYHASDAATRAYRKYHRPSASPTREGSPNARLAAQNRPSLQRGGPVGLVEPPVSSASSRQFSAFDPHSSDSPAVPAVYRGFGREVPSIREQAMQYGGGSSHGAADGSLTYMQTEGKRFYGLDAHTPRGIAHHTTGNYGANAVQTRWPPDGFSKEYHSIVRALDA